jgi:hypothetical protein
MPPAPKKPVVYLFVILPIFLGGAFGIIAGLLAAYATMAETSPSAMPNVNGVLISVPALLLWIPLTLLIANCVLFAVPSLKRVAEKYAAEAQRPHFVESQVMLGKVAMVMALVCVPLITLGFVL